MLNLSECNFFVCKMGMKAPSPILLLKNKNPACSFFLLRRKGQGRGVDLGMCRHVGLVGSIYCDARAPIVFQVLLGQRNLASVSFLLWMTFPWKAQERGVLTGWRPTDLIPSMPEWDPGPPCGDDHTKARGIRPAQPEPASGPSCQHADTRFSLKPKLLKPVFRSLRLNYLSAC